MNVREGAKGRGQRVRTRANVREGVKGRGRLNEQEGELVRENRERASEKLGQQRVREKTQVRDILREREEE